MVWQKYVRYFPIRINTFALTQYIYIIFTHLGLCIDMCGILHQKILTKKKLLPKDYERISNTITTERKNKTESNKKKTEKTI